MYSVYMVTFLAAYVYVYISYMAYIPSSSILHAYMHSPSHRNSMRPDRKVSGLIGASHVCYVYISRSHNSQ